MSSLKDEGKSRTAELLRSAVTMLREDDLDRSQGDHAGLGSEAEPWAIHDILQGKTYGMATVQTHSGWRVARHTTGNAPQGNASGG